MTITKEEYEALRDDYQTALYYRKLTEGFPDLKERFFRLHDEYYAPLLGHEVVRPSRLELETTEA
jgi:hypothetical protein